MKSLNLLEVRLILRSLTWRRAYNLLLVLISYYAARWLGRPYHWAMPVSLGIEPTTACNLRCPECPSGLRAFTRPTGRLQAGVWQAALQELHPTLLYLILYFQGEPFLNPHFTELVAAAHAKGLYTLTSTNAHFLDDATARRTVESGLTHLIVSLDGLTQETYAAYRQEGQFNKVMEGIQNILHWKRLLGSSTPFVELQFIVFSHNEHEIEGVKQLGRQLGVNRVAIKTAQLYNAQLGHELLPSRQQHSRYRADGKGGLQLKNKLLNHCWKLWQGAEVTWDGRVLPCCFDKDAQHQMGQLPLQSFKSIWQGQRYRQFRTRLLTARSKVDICTNCTEGTRVWSS